MKKNTVLIKFRDNLVVIGLFALAIVTAITSPTFLSTQNFTNLMYQFVALGFVALGMTYVLLGAYTDLSVAGLFSLVGVVSAMLMLQYGAIVGIIAGLIIGTLCGAFTGKLLTVVGANTQAKALFITFGMSSIYIAFALLIGKGMTFHIYDYFPICTFLGSGKVGFVAVSFIIYLIFLGILFVFEKKTYYGRAIKYMGGNATAASLCGMPVKKLKLLIYALCGLMTAVGSIMNLCRVTTANSGSGRNMETNAILSVVVGGTALAGGRGSVLRTVIGVAVVTLMANCLNLMGVSTYLQNVVKGAILVIAIWLDFRKEQ